MNQFGKYCGPQCKCKKLGHACGPRCRCGGSDSKCGCHPNFTPGEVVDWSNPDTIDNAPIKAVKEHLEGIQLSSFGSNIELRNRVRDFYRIPLSITLPSKKPSAQLNPATLALLSRPRWRI